MCCVTDSIKVLDPTGVKQEVRALQLGCACIIRHHQAMMCCCGTQNVKESLELHLFITLGDGVSCLPVKPITHFFAFPLLSVAVFSRRQVRKQMAERATAHEDRNLARQLTPAERRDKKLRKLFEGGSSSNAGSSSTVAAVYRVESLAHGQHRFKVDVNAKENHMSGG
jgi:hypothetical protein